MCGGAIISDFVPILTKAKGRKLTAEELWSELDASAGDYFWGFHPTSNLQSTSQQGKNIRFNNTKFTIISMII